MIIQEKVNVVVKEANDLNNTKRGENGFGSSGLK